MGEEEEGRGGCFYEPTFNQWKESPNSQEIKKKIFN